MVIRGGNLSNWRWAPWSPQKVEVETSWGRRDGRTWRHHIGGLITKSASEEGRRRLQLGVGHGRWRGNCGNERIAIPAVVQVGEGGGRHVREQGGCLRSPEVDPWNRHRLLGWSLGIGWETACRGGGIHCRIAKRRSRSGGRAHDPGHPGKPQLVQASGVEVRLTGVIVKLTG